MSLDLEIEMEYPRTIAGALFGNFATVSGCLIFLSQNPNTNVTNLEVIGILALILLLTILVSGLCALLGLIFDKLEYIQKKVGVLKK